MYLQKDKNVLDRLDKLSDLQVIYIKCESHLFYRRFSDVSKFFRSIKNGLYRTGGLTNRQFFKGLSGVYFSLESQNIVELIIIYDMSIRSLNGLQTITRIKKLLGLSVSVEIGGYEEYFTKIQDFIKIRRTIQPFGDLYFNKPTNIGNVS